MKAGVYFGSVEATKERMSERRSPYSGEVVSYAPLCDADDAKKVLLVAKEAAKEAAKTTLAQRCSWLLDVAQKLREHK